VQSEIRFKLNELPEAPYPELVWEDKVEAVWQFVYGRGGGNPARDLRARLH
jgi:type I restriction enzyme R subunit